MQNQIEDHSTRVAQSPSAWLRSQRSLKFPLRRLGLASFEQMAHQHETRGVPDLCKGSSSEFLVGLSTGHGQSAHRCSGDSRDCAGRIAKCRRQHQVALPCAMFVIEMRCRSGWTVTGIAHQQRGSLIHASLGASLRENDCPQLFRDCSL